MLWRGDDGRGVAGRMNFASFPTYFFSSAHDLFVNNGLQELYLFVSSVGLGITVPFCINF